MGQQGLMTGCDTADWTTVFIMRVAITGCALSPNLPAVPALTEPCRTCIFSTSGMHAAPCSWSGAPP